MELLIYSLETDETPVSRLSNGEHVFGRGELLKCDDKRVSRNHGIIKVEPLSATITSTHHNPCFHQSASSSTITILPKNNPVTIQDGDKFALLADKFWYRVKIKLDTPVAPMELYEMSDDSNTSIDFLQINEKRKNDDEFELSNSKKLKLDENIVSEEATEPLLTLFGSKEISDKQTTVISDNDDSNTSIDFLKLTDELKDQVKPDLTTSTILQHEANPENNLHPQILNKVDTIPCSSKDLSSESNNLLRKIDKNSPLVNFTNVESENTNTVGKECISESDDDISVPNFGNNKKKELLSDSDNDNKINKVKKLKKKTPNKDRQAKLKAMLFSSDEEDVTEKAEPKKKKDPECKLAAVAINEGIEPVDNEEAQDSNDAGPSGTNDKKVWRDRCRYGASCYRKNKSHLQEYKHPGDSDYESDPNDSRPLCIYGDACYRLNKDHRRDYRHSKNNQPALNKKQTKNAPKKKRAGPKQYKESSDDDYDLQDPFIDDSGSDFAVNSVSEDDTTESEISDGAEEETKRLVKEAKRFAKQ